jgi:hypothetical protein
MISNLLKLPQPFKGTKMTTLNNREKNIAHTARQAAKVRPLAPAYNFEDLDRVMRSWVAPAVEQEEVYSPYYGA